MPNKDDEIFDLEDDSTESTIIEDDELQNEEFESANQISDSPEPLETKQNSGFKQKFKAILKDLWQNPKKRWSLISVVCVCIMVSILFPTSRYAILNTVGVRSSASVKVLDESTSQPLKNVNVVLAGVNAKTNEEGIAQFVKLKQGKTKLTISKRAFSENSHEVTLGWGSNPLGDKKLKPVGLQFSFDIKDFLSEKPITKAEVVSGEYSAFSDEKGHAVLTIDETSEDEIEVSVKANSYRTESIDQLIDNKESKSIMMAPEKKHIFVSKRSGKYDVFKIDADGKNEQLILSGTGNERDDMALVSNPNKNIAALVSTRDNTRNKDGFQLSTLTLVELNGDEVNIESITKAEKIQIIGWSGDRLVYVRIAEGDSGNNPDRQRLISYDFETRDSKELAKSNYFNDVLMIGDDIYYAPSAALQTKPTSFYKVNSKGENQKTVFDNEVWNIYRTSYNTLMFSVKEDWYEYDISNSKVLATSGAPASQISRIYIDNSDKNKSLWIEQRDGKGTLISYDINSKEDKTIKAQSGLTYPIIWLNSETVIYRINTVAESADYVVNIAEGKSRKIQDVTNTDGIDRWYF